MGPKRRHVTSEWLPAADLDDAFGALANELRIETLRILWENRMDPLSFSELQTRLDLYDSGKFNYHLDRLVPEFVRKTGEGYVLTHAGRQVIGAAVSGSLTEADEVDIGPVPAGDCMFCDGELAARYDRGRVVVDCPDCEELMAAMPVPPSAVADLEPERLPAVFSDYLLTLTDRVSRGFCIRCSGRVEPTLTALSPAESVAHRPALNVRFDCPACGNETNLNAGAVVLNHPAVASFLFDAGVDPRTACAWELTSMLDPDTEVVSEDPLGVRLDVELDGGTLSLVLDESASVVEYERG
jgi:hypothetical protein